MSRQEDAVKFLEMLLEDCYGTSDHEWRKCRRCMAMSRLENRDPFALKLLTEAIARLKVNSA